MRQTLILHIGTHKTGSTTIQNYLYYNRLWLKTLGIYYPRPKNGWLFYSNNHSDLRDTAIIEGRPRGAKIHSDFGSHDALLGRYIRTIKDVGQSINILSAEGWSSHLNRYAARLAPLRQHFDVKVLAFFRRPDFWIEKFYSQRVANVEHAEKRTFSQFVEQPHIETYLYNRYQMFGWWAKIFGSENFSAIPFEPAVSDFDLLDRFFDGTGILGPLPRRLLFRHSRANRTLAPSGVEFLRNMHVNGTVPDQKTIRKLKSASFQGDRSFLSDQERNSILERAASDMDRICKDYVRDGRQVLFPTTPEHVYVRGKT